MVFTGIFLCVQFKPSARCREFLGKDRPKEIAHKVDPRIVPSKKESVLLKATRCDRFGVIYQNDRHNRCKVGNEVFGACSKQGAPLQRAEFVQRSGPSRGSGSFDRVQPCVYAGQCVARSRDDSLAFPALLRCSCRVRPLQSELRVLESRCGGDHVLLAPESGLVEPHKGRSGVPLRGR